jgi:hypothetical protein
MVGCLATCQDVGFLMSIQDHFVTFATCATQAGFVVVIVLFILKYMSRFPIWREAWGEICIAIRCLRIDGWCSQPCVSRVLYILTYDYLTTELPNSNSGLLLPTNLIHYENSHVLSSRCHIKLLTLKIIKNPSLSWNPEERGNTILCSWEEWSLRGGWLFYFCHWYTWDWYEF